MAIFGPWRWSCSPASSTFGPSSTPTTPGLFDQGLHPSPTFPAPKRLHQGDEATKWQGFVLFAVLVLMLSACASQPMPGGSGLPGFWLGLWHGLTMPFALIGHLFDSTIRIYAFPNHGGWYDFGFVLGSSSFAGAGAAAR